MLERGRVVRSTSGKDKDTFSAVLSSEKNYVLVSDGRKRPLEKPKIKNIKHISLTSFVLEEKKLATNRQLRNALRSFQGNDDN